MITPVHNQGEMGCSDPLILSDAISSLHAIVSKDLVPFSYQQLFECCWHCNCSGLANVSSDCITKLNLCPTPLYPSQPPSQCQCFDEKCTFRVKGVRAVPTGQETALQSAILISPVMAAIDVTTSLQVSLT